MRFSLQQPRSSSGRLCFVRIVVAALLVSALFSTHAFAQLGAGISTPKYVNSNNKKNNQCGGESFPATATNGAGVWVSVWLSKECTNGVQTGNRVAVSRSVDGGVTWSSLQYLDVDRRANQPRITFGNGVFVVYWMTKELGGDADQVYVRSVNGGLSWSAATPINTDASSDASYPLKNGDDYDLQLATDGEGNWVALWAGFDDYSGPRSDSEVQVARSNNDAATWSTPETLPRPDTGGRPRHLTPLSIAHGDGSWVAVVGMSRKLDCDINPVNCGTDDLAFMGSLNGAQWSPLRVSLDDGWEGVAKLATDGNGRWVLSYASSPTPTPSGFGNYQRLAMSLDAGRTWGAAIPPTTGPIEWSDPITLAYSAPNEWVAVWAAQGWSGGTDLDVLVARSELAHDVWTTPIALDSQAASDGTTWDFDPAIAASGGGRIVALWTESPRNASGGVVGPDVQSAWFEYNAFEFVDPNPDLLEGAEVTSDPFRLGTAQAPVVRGLVADGVSRVVIRHRVSGAGSVRFRILNENGVEEDDATLQLPGGSSGGPTQSVPVYAFAGGTYQAFVVLRAPLNFVRRVQDEPLGNSSPRLLRVEAEFIPSRGSRVTTSAWLDLDRPPIVMVHGLWSSASTWTWPSVLLASKYPVVARENYEATNADAFWVNDLVVPRGILNAVAEARARGLAATQVDIMAHSMGGLLSRRYINGVTRVPYLRDQNFRAGDVRSLTTVDTPHFGSPLADVLIGLRSNPLYGSIVGDFCRTIRTCIDCGAVADLSPSGAELLNLGATDVPVHAMVGKGGSDLLQAGGGTISGPLGAFYSVLQFFGYSPDDVFSPGTQHDLIVGRSSQEGGLPSAASPTPSCGVRETTVFGTVDTSERDLGIHTSMTSSAVVGACAEELLQTRIGVSPAFAVGGFPARSAFGETPLNRASSGSAEPWSGVTGGEIRIVAPAPGSVFAPGASIGVEVSSVGDFVPSAVSVAGPGQVVVVTEAPWSASITIDPTAVGPMTLGAIARDAAGRYVAASEVVVNVVVPGSLQAILASPTRVVLTTDLPEQAMWIRGEYSDGVTRTLTAGAVGTRYTVEDPAIAVVNADGLVSARGVGKTTMTITNGSVVALVAIVVESVP